MQQAYQELGLLMVLLWVIIITISRCSKGNFKYLKRTPL
jgi:hypothetical protein